MTQAWSAAVADNPPVLCDSQLAVHLCLKHATEGIIVDFLRAAIWNQHLCIEWWLLIKEKVALHRFAPVSLGQANGELPLLL